MLLHIGPNGGVNWKETSNFVRNYWHMLRPRLHTSRASSESQAFIVGGKKEATFKCVCQRVLPTYVAEVDHYYPRTNFNAIVPEDQNPSPKKPDLSLFDDTALQKLVIMDGKQVRQSRRETLEKKKHSKSALVSLTTWTSSLQAYASQVVVNNMGRYVFPDEGIIPILTEDFRLEFRNFEIGGAMFCLSKEQVPKLEEIIRKKSYNFTQTTTVKEVMECDLENLQLLCGYCNRSKGKKSMLSWMTQQQKKHKLANSKK